MIGIATVNKDFAMLLWMEQCDLLRDSLLFSWLGENPGNCAFAPVQGETYVKRYINGDAQRVYDFALQVTLKISDVPDTTNTDNMYLQRTWADWIEQQNNAQNYPDFGEKCSDYFLELLSNSPTLAQHGENGTGKYQFFARLNYMEAR